MNEHFTERCAECKFFIVEDHVHGQGFCRRYPPTAFLMMAVPAIALAANQQPQPTPMSSYPPVQRSQWCGEYVRKMDA